MLVRPGAALRCRNAPRGRRHDRGSTPGRAGATVGFGCREMAALRQRSSRPDGNSPSAIRWRRQCRTAAGLLERLRILVGISGKLLCQFRSYLANRVFCISTRGLTL
ncbi:unnamed protein product [Lampetra fluviatilis]